MKFLLGLLIGIVLGAGGTWAAFKQPWKSKAVAVEDTPDAGAEEPVATKKKKSKGKKKRATGGGDTEEYYIDEPAPVLTAADRESIWKGPAVELPPRQIDMESGGEARPLTGAEINQTIGSSSKGITRCIATARGAAELKADISLKLLVGGDGRVQKVRARAPRYLFDHDFYGCVDGAAKSLRFPATGAPTVVDAPFELY